MLNAWQLISVWFEQALVGMAAPWAIAIALALTTLLLEDVAIAAGVALATQGAISWTASLAAVIAGIAIGDVALYAMGVAATHVPWLRRRYVGEATSNLHAKLARRLPAAILMARVVPGLRLVTYTACGFARVPLLAFNFWVLLAVFAWTLGLYAASALVGAGLANYLGIPESLAVALPIVALALAAPLARRWSRRRSQASA